MLMHSLDTVKTRQQGDPHIPPKYTSLGQSYYTIWRQEGIRKGLYGGWLPALGGSFPGTVMFFGTYEWSKRFLIDAGLQQHISYLAAGKSSPSSFSMYVTNSKQASSVISQHRLSTSPPKSSRPDCNFKAATTTHTSDQVTTTAERSMLPGPSSRPKVLRLSSTDTAPLFTATFLSPHSSSCSGSSSRLGRGGIRTAETLACLLNFSQVPLLVGWRVRSHVRSTW